MKSYELKMTNGSVVKNIFLFTVPLIISTVMQLLFNSADLIIVGKFDSDTALAAVGSTSSVINLLISICVGYATGSSVVISKYFGAGNGSGTKRAVSTCVTMAIIFGLAMLLIGVCAARAVLHLMSCPEDVIGSAAVYMRIYFFGMPAFMVYNFGSGILRAVGDTRRPLIFVAISGLVNILLNLFFVINLRMGVAGVATATVISQFVSAFLIIRCLVSTNESYRLDIKALKIYKREFVQMTRIGLPTGIQGSLFSLSNVIIQSSVNTFGGTVIAGNTAGVNFESFFYAIANSIAQAAMTFTGQNFGAGNYKRIKRGFLSCMAIDLCILSVLSVFVAYFGEYVLRIYSNDPEVVAIAFKRITITCALYFLLGFNDVSVGVLRGLGSSVLPMITSVFGICGLRILFIMTVFRSLRTLESLYYTYPLSWGITAAVNCTLILVLWKRLIKHE